MRDHHTSLFAAVVAISCAMGCIAEQPAFDPVVEGSAQSSSFARFRPPSEGGEVSLPFPSDFHRNEAGISLAHAPDVIAQLPFRAAVEAELTTRGFCTTCGITFEIEGGLADDALAADGHLGESGDPADSVLLVDIDPVSPARGSLVPIRTHWDQTTGRLTVRPARGEVLARDRMYAAVLTSELLGADGLGLSPSPSFERIRSDAVDADLVVAQMLSPAFETLDSLGISRDRVVSVAPLTTGDPTAPLRAIRAEIQTATAPRAALDRVWEGEQIEGLMGTPAENRAGFDVAPMPGLEGDAAIRHESTHLIVSGTFDAARFVEGSGADVGALTRDSDGNPTSLSREDVPFVLLIPVNADISNLPVVIAQHGFSASRKMGFVLADTVGEAGYAVLAIDGYQHGDRAPSASDRSNSMRGDLPGADGFAETTGAGVVMRIFGLTGVDESQRLFPGYPLAAFTQFAADVLSAVRFVQGGELTSLQSAHADLAELAFDSDRIAFVGNSMGAVVGTAVAAVEPAIDALVLNVMPGSIVDTLIESGEFRPLTDRLLFPLLGLEPLTGGEDTAGTDPVVNLFRWVLEPIDPLALAPFIQRDRVIDDPAPNLLIQLAAHDEVAAPAASQFVVAAAGIRGEGEFAFAPVGTAGGPAWAGGHYARAVMFAPAMHGMLEVSAQESSYEAPLLSPLERREQPTMMANPVDEVHDSIQRFLEAFDETRSAETP